MGKRITMIRLGTYSGYLKTEVGKAPDRIVGDVEVSHFAGAFQTGQEVFPAPGNGDLVSSWWCANCRR